MDCLTIQSEVESRVVWLDELSSKVQSELDFLSGLLTQTNLMITDTYYCYSTLDQVNLASNVVINIHGKGDYFQEILWVCT